MRSFLSLFAALFLMVTVFGSSADARPADRGVQKPRTGILARLVELERRKNAWLRENFLD